MVWNWYMEDIALFKNSLLNLEDLRYCMTLSKLWYSLKKSVNVSLDMLRWKFLQMKLAVKAFPIKNAKFWDGYNFLLWFFFSSSALPPDTVAQEIGFVPDLCHFAN